ncbi:MAG: hypothetical protein AAGH79_00255 [Bacteroidota bacterium]
MAYQSRRRNYTSRRERLANSIRKARIVILFAFIAIALYLFFNWRSIYDYLRTYTY